MRALRPAQIPLSRAPVFIAIALEIFVAAMIRDNLTLNILMFLWPIDSVLHWQQAR